jgi:hypothetical protein
VVAELILELEEDEAALLEFVIIYLAAAALVVIQGMAVFPVTVTLVTQLPEPVAGELAAVLHL